MAAGRRAGPRRPPRRRPRPGRRTPALVGEADQHRPPVRRRGNAHDQAAALRAVDQAGDAGFVALHRRVPIQPGQSVLVLGATGNAGAMAVQVVRRLGAGGRALAAAAAESDIVLDYLWGKPAQHAITALLTARSDRSREMNWVQIGSVAGPALELPSAALRSANFRLQGSGQGSVSPRAYLAELPSLVAEITAGTIAVTATTMPLADVEQIWAQAEAPGERTVLVP